MKTLESIKNELAMLRKEAEGQLSKRESKALEKRIKGLYACQLYLETMPTQEFIEKQKTDVSKKIKSISAGFDKWLSSNPSESDNIKNPKSKYNTLMGLKNMKAQLVTINFLLG